MMRDNRWLTDASLMVRSRQGCKLFQRNRVNLFSTQETTLLTLILYFYFATFTFKTMMCIVQRSKQECLLHTKASLFIGWNCIWQPSSLDRSHMMSNWSMEKRHQCVSCWMIWSFEWCARSFEWCARSFEFLYSVVRYTIRFRRTCNCMLK